MANLAANHEHERPRAFANGKVDPVEAGRKGGQASVLARRLAGQRRLERKIAESRNGAALFQLLRVRMEREAELEAQRIAADRELVELETWTLSVKEELEQALEQCASAEAELERVRSELEAAKHDDAALVTLLRECGESRVEAACDELGWIERESDALAS